MPKQWLFVGFQHSGAKVFCFVFRQQLQLLGLLVPFPCVTVSGLGAMNFHLIFKKVAFVKSD